MPSQASQNAELELISAAWLEAMCCSDSTFRPLLTTTPSSAAATRKPPVAPAGVAAPGRASGQTPSGAGSEQEAHAGGQQRGQRQRHDAVDRVGDTPDDINGRERERVFWRER